jgi:hypothetical protein
MAPSSGSVESATWQSPNRAEQYTRLSAAGQQLYSKPVGVCTHSSSIATGTRSRSNPITQGPEIRIGGVCSRFNSAPAATRVQRLAVACEHSLSFAFKDVDFERREITAQYCKGRKTGV